MNTTANIQVYPATPFAFKNKRFKQCLKSNTKKMIEQMNLEKDIRQKYKRRLLCQLFNVKIKGGNLQQLNLKQCIKFTINQINNGKGKCESIKRYLQLNNKDKI